MDGSFSFSEDLLQDSSFGGGFSINVGDRL